MSVCLIQISNSLLTFTKEPLRKTNLWEETKSPVPSDDTAENAIDSSYVMERL